MAVRRRTQSVFYKKKYEKFKNAKAPDRVELKRESQEFIEIMKERKKE